MTLFCPRVRFVRNAALISFAALAPAACHDSLAPRDVYGVYVLESVAGSPLPAVYRQGAYGVDGLHTTTVFADTITVFENGRGTWGGSHWVIALVINGESTELFNEHSNPHGFSYEIRHGVLYLQPDPPVFSLYSRATIAASK